MAGPHKGHDWSRSKKSEEDEEDEEDDPVDGMLKKAGCLELHHAVQVRIKKTGPTLRLGLVINHSH